MKRAALLALAAVLLAGCSTVTVSRNGPTMVNIENSGWYLLNFIPLASSKAEITDIITECGHDINIRGERLTMNDICTLSDKLYKKINS